MRRTGGDLSFLDGLDRGEPFVPVPAGQLLVRLVLVLATAAAVGAVWGIVIYGFYAAVTA